MKIGKDIFIRIDDFSPTLKTLLFGGESISVEVSLTIPELTGLRDLLIIYLDIEKWAGVIEGDFDHIDNLINRMLEENQFESLDINHIIKAAKAEGLSEISIKKEIDSMKRIGILWEPEKGLVNKP